MKTMFKYGSRFVGGMVFFWFFAFVMLPVFGSCAFDMEPPQSSFPNEDPTPRAGSDGLIGGSYAP